MDFTWENACISCLTLDSCESHTERCVQEHLRELQMQVIRSEKPPLSGVYLTPEQDQQLVEEGVLPPLDQYPRPQPPAVVLRAVADRAAVPSDAGHFTWIKNEDS